MANVLERKAWSHGQPDANSEVPQKQKEKYLHPDAVIRVVKSSSLKRVQDAVILFSHSTHFPYLGKEKSPLSRTLCRGYSSSRDCWDTFKGMFPKAAADLAHTRSPWE